MPALLFALLSRNYGLSLEQLGRLVFINFATRFVIDVLAIRLADKIGYRTCLTASQVFAAAGLLLFGTLPMMLPRHLIYLGLCLTMILFAAGGGLVQVLVNPVVTQVSGLVNARALSRLHAFFPMGVALAISGTTVALWLIPEAMWHIIPIGWMIVPLATLYCFATVPMAEPRMRGKPLMPFRELARSKGFWPCVGLLFFTGMTEAGMGQWSSAFIELSLGMPKIVGDLLGPCLSALLKVLMRITYDKWEHKVPLKRLLPVCAIGCMLCFLGMAMIPNPWLALMASAFAGLFIAMLWPGSLHRAAQRFPNGGTALFGMLALGGDTGCAAGPWIIGAVSGRTTLNHGFAAGALFPLGYFLMRLMDRNNERISRISDKKFHEEVNHVQTTCNHLE